jgi:hypothetical protein
MLGLTPNKGEAIDHLHKALVATRDHEGEESERLIRAGHKYEAMIHSGRRGVLDTARYEIEQALKAIEALEQWEAKRTARKAR